MKFLKAALFSLLLSTPALAIELSEATNQQILDELSTRLQSAGGGGQNVFFDYWCAWNKILYVRVIQENGQYTDETFSLVDYPDCADYAALFSQKRYRVQASTLLAICYGPQRTVHRVALTPSGTLTRLPNLDFSTVEACQAEASRINARP